jgi:hypothetical protein
MQGKLANTAALSAAFFYVNGHRRAAMSGLCGWRCRAALTDAAFKQTHGIGHQIPTDDLLHRLYFQLVIGVLR